MPEVMLSRRALLAEATAELGGAGVREPRREALRLWAELRRSATEAIVRGASRWRTSPVTPASAPSRYAQIVAH